uniref:C-type lectin domain-containing protein n=1 Tax=Anas platyrhynchos platyrhynchos TaxID=8840 RepID=A0A493TDG6_ANAPP
HRNPLLPGTAPLGGLRVLSPHPWVGPSPAPPVLPQAHAHRGLQGQRPLGPPAVSGAPGAPQCHGAVGLGGQQTLRKEHRGQGGVGDPSVPPPCGARGALGQPCQGGGGGAQGFVHTSRGCSSQPRPPPHIKGGWGPQQGDKGGGTKQRGADLAALRPSVGLPGVQEAWPKRGWGLGARGLGSHRWSGACLSVCLSVRLSRHPPEAPAHPRGGHPEALISLPALGAAPQRGYKGSGAATSCTSPAPLHASDTGRTRMGPAAFLCLLGLLSLPSLPGVQANKCPKGWLDFRGSCYGYFGQELTWRKAEAWCKVIHAGCHLASLHSPEEHAAVARFIAKFQRREEEDNVWIGLHHWVSCRGRTTPAARGTPSSASTLPRSRTTSELPPGPAVLLHPASPRPSACNPGPSAPPRSHCPRCARGGGPLNKCARSTPWCCLFLQLHPCPAPCCPLVMAGCRAAHGGALSAAPRCVV